MFPVSVFPCMFVQLGNIVAGTKFASYEAKIFKNILEGEAISFYMFSSFSHVPQTRNIIFSISHGQAMLWYLRKRKQYFKVRAN